MTAQPLTKDEQVRFAGQIYIFQDALVDFVRRHKKSDRAVRQTSHILRDLEQLRCMMDGVYCAQFPDNPRPADPDFYDSPYISAAVCKKAREMTNQP